MKRAHDNGPPPAFRVIPDTSGGKKSAKRAALQSVTFTLRKKRKVRYKATGSK